MSAAPDYKIINTRRGKRFSSQAGFTLVEFMIAVGLAGLFATVLVSITLTTGRSWFWSRSRQEYWCKGETSGDRQWVREAYYDCDGDAVLLVVEQEGRGACHTGERTCFFRAFKANAETE